MGAMTRLLQKPLKVFAWYALIVLLVSIPVYVLVIDFIWTTELDENNWLTLQHTRRKLEVREFTDDEIEKINTIWGALQPGVSIQKAPQNHGQEDSIYEVIRPNLFDYNDAEDRFRGLVSYVKIKGEPYKLTIETNVEEWDETFVAIAITTLIFFCDTNCGFHILKSQYSR